MFNAPVQERQRSYLAVIISLLLATSIPMGYAEARWLKGFYVSHLFLLLGIAQYYYAHWNSLKLVLWNRGNRAFAIAIGAFCAWMLFSSLTSPMGDHHQAFTYWIRSLGLPLLLAGIVLREMACDAQGFLSVLKKGMLLSGVILAVIGIGEGLFPNAVRWHFLNEVRWPDSLRSYFAGNSGGLDVDRFYPAAGLFEHYNAFGVEQMLCALWCASDLVDRFAESHKSFFRRSRHLWALFAIFMIGIAFSTSKTALISLVLGITGIIVFKRKKLRLSAFRLSALVSGVLIAAALVFAINPGSRKRITYLIESPSRLGSIALQGRDQIYANTLTIFRAYPIRGVGCFQLARATEMMKLPPPIVIHAHNLLLSVLAEGGTVGLFLLLCVLAVVFRKARRHEDLQNMILLLAVFLFSQMTELFLNHVLWYSAFFFVLLATGGAEQRITGIQKY